MYHSLWQDIPQAGTYHAPCVDGCRRSPRPKSQVEVPFKCNLPQLKILNKFFLGCPCPPAPAPAPEVWDFLLDLSPLTCTSFHQF